MATDHVRVKSSNLNEKKMYEFYYFQTKIQILFLFL